MNTRAIALYTIVVERFAGARTCVCDASGVKGVEEVGLQLERRVAHRRAEGAPQLPVGRALRRLERPHELAQHRPRLREPPRRVQRREARVRARRAVKGRAALGLEDDEEAVEPVQVDEARARAALRAQRRAGAARGAPLPTATTRTGGASTEARRCRLLLHETQRRAAPVVALLAPSMVGGGAGRRRRRRRPDPGPRRASGGGRRRQRRAGGGARRGATTRPRAAAQSSRDARGRRGGAARGPIPARRRPPPPPPPPPPAAASSGSAWNIRARSLA